MQRTNKIVSSTIIVLVMVGIAYFRAPILNAADKNTYDNKKFSYRFTYPSTWEKISETDASVILSVPGSSSAPVRTTVEVVALPRTSTTSILPTVMSDRLHNVSRITDRACPKRTFGKETWCIIMRGDWEAPKGAGFNWDYAFNILYGLTKGNLDYIVTYRLHQKNAGTMDNISNEPDLVSLLNRTVSEEVVNLLSSFTVYASK